MSHVRETLRILRDEFSESIDKKSIDWMVAGELLSHAKKTEALFDVAFANREEQHSQSFRSDFKAAKYKRILQQLQVLPSFSELDGIEADAEHHIFVLANDTLVDETDLPPKLKVLHQSDLDRIIGYYEATLQQYPALKPQSSQEIQKNKNRAAKIIAVSCAGVAAIGCCVCVCAPAAAITIQQLLQ